MIMKWYTGTDTVSIVNNLGRATLGFSSMFKKGKKRFEPYWASVHLSIKMKGDELLYKMGDGHYTISAPIKTESSYADHIEFAYRMQPLVAHTSELLAEYLDFSEALNVVDEAESPDVWIIGKLSEGEESASYTKELNRYIVKFIVNQYGRRFEIVNLEQPPFDAGGSPLYGTNFQCVTKFDKSKSLAENAGESVAQAKVALTEWASNVDFIKQFASDVMDSGL